LVRPIAIVISAILLSRPGMPREEASRYAAVLNEEAREHDFDPLTAVAIIHFETQWQAGLISASGEDYGLGQVRARYVAGCRDDEDPVHHPSEACKAAKARLLDGEHNIRRMASLITANRDFCKQKTGSRMVHRWLASYQGYNVPSKDLWCRPGEKTWRVLRYRKGLLATLMPSLKQPAAPSMKPPSAGQPAAKPAMPARGRKPGG
jgi:hypothetical protein